MDAPGRIEVVCGPMFAGKTEELLRRVRRAAIAGRRIRVVTHALDARGGPDRLASHAGLGYPSISVSDCAGIERAVDDAADMVAIDEAQFFGPGLVATATRLASRGLLVVIAGLDVTFEGRPFEPLPTLMAVAERVDKLTAVCTICGADAVFHVRVGAAGRPATDLVAEHVGSQDKYQARCRHHFPAAT